MRIGILCAGDEELAPFLPLIQNRRVVNKAKLDFHLGQIAGVETAALYSGVCKVNAAIAAQLLIETFQADAVINAGTAGGIDPKLQIFDTVISAEAVHHDVAPDILTDFHPWMKTEFFPADEGLLARSKIAVDRLNPPRRVFWGRMATGEAFIDSAGRQAINHRYAPLSVDMETAAVAQVCHAFAVPFISIRSITDTASHSGIDNFEENCKTASGIARNITLALMAELRENPI